MAVFATNGYMEQCVIKIGDLHVGGRYKECGQVVVADVYGRKGGSRKDLHAIKYILDVYI